MVQLKFICLCDILSVLLNSGCACMSNGGEVLSEYEK